MLFVRPTAVGREKELKVYKILEKVQFRNPFPEKKPEIRSEAASGSIECTKNNSDGTVTHGTKVNGVWQGPFTKTYPDGRRWEGTYTDGKVDGKITFIYRNGSRMDGEWHNGNWNGPGTYYAENGVLRGVWKDGEVDGGATYTYENGAEYTGGIRKYTRDAAGKRYQRDGAGRLRLPGNTVIEGTFAVDRLSGEVKVLFPNGDMYTGKWSNGFSGAGEYRSGCCPGILELHYKGFWKNGKMHGQGSSEKGKLTMRITGDKTYIYYGEFRDGSASGEGLLQSRRGGEAAEPVSSGRFENNVMATREKNLETRTIESFLNAAVRHINNTVRRELETAFADGVL